MYVWNEIFHDLGSGFLHSIESFSWSWEWFSTAFIVVGLKESTHLAVQTIPEVTFNGQWLTEKISDNIDNLKEIGLCAQGIVTDNISYKV